MKMRFLFFLFFPFFSCATMKQESVQKPVENTENLPIKEKHNCKENICEYKTSRMYCYDNGKKARCLKGNPDADHIIGEMSE